MKNKIVYQGVAGSNNEVAALQLAKTYNLQEVNYIEGTSSKGVVDALIRKDANYGVVATYNNLVGDVSESTIALDGIRYNIVATTKLHIHHALFTQDANSTITEIASHPHALAQCANYLADKYPDAKLTEISDTAIGARYLSDGTFSNNTGILCRRNAGEHFKLHLISENVADAEDNYTTFILFHLN